MKGAAPMGGIKVLDRLMDVLSQLTPDTPGLGVVQIAQATGLSPGTAHRLLAALEGHHLVAKDPNSKRYRLGLRLFELGALAARHGDLSLLVNQHLQELVQSTGETGNIGVFDHGSVLYVAKVEGWHALRMPSRVGARLDAYCTALGKVLLSHLSQEERTKYLRHSGMPFKTARTITGVDRFNTEAATIVQNGYAVDDEEQEIGLRCIAAPIYGHTGRVVAAASLSGPTTRITLEAVPEIAARVIACAQATSDSLNLDPPNL
jgi:DNA-binding IclR family transcriptional regulator